MAKQGEVFNTYVQGIDLETKELMGEYKKRFASRALAVVEDFRNKGMKRPLLDVLALNPTNRLGIERVAGDLMALARKDAD